MHDIFISYAHVDDDPLPGVEAGWVSTFVLALRKYLARETGRREHVSLWMDYELRGNHSLTPTIMDVIAQTRTFIAFLSEAYLSSTWCMQELQAFVDRVGAGSARLFVIYISPVTHLPAALEDLKLYQFWYEDERGDIRTLADPQPDPTERDYYFGIRDVARDLARVVQEREVVEKDFGDIQVFVHGGHDDVDLIRSTARRLEDHGIGYTLPVTALSDYDPSTVGPDIVTRDLRDQMAMCDAVLLVHKFGPGIQVRQLVTEYRKSMTRRDGPPAQIALCQATPDPGAIGVNSQSLSVLCVDDVCAEDCVNRFLDSLRA